MKINWGIGIVIAILAFILFITYFLVKATIDNTYNHELVTENYYEKELQFEKLVQLEEATQKSGMQVAINYENGKGIQLTFPEKTKGNHIMGKVNFYRPDNEKLDFQLPIQTNEIQRMEIPHEQLLTGRWNISVEYTIDHQKTYITNFKITY